MSATLSSFVDLSPRARFADWTDLPAKAHTVQFYGDDSILLDGLSGFVGAALGAGDAAIVIATEAHRRGLSNRLEARGLDVKLAQAEGRFVVLDAAQTLAEFTVNGALAPKIFHDKIAPVIERATEACVSDSPRVAAFGEMVALLWAQGKGEQAVQLEGFWNDLAKTHSFHLRCAYPISGFDQAAHVGSFQLICAEHSHVLPSESYTSLPNEQERVRTVTEWQQKALALETEIAERKKTEQALRDLPAASHQRRAPAPYPAGSSHRHLGTRRRDRRVCLLGGSLRNVGVFQGSGSHQTGRAQPYVLHGRPRELSEDPLADYPQKPGF